MTEISDSEIVFRDLESAYEQLLLTRDSTVAVRRGLREFVTLSQQLTEVLRNEFKRLYGRNWVAADFEGWTKITALFKKLRRSDYHEFPFLIAVRQKRYLPLNQIIPRCKDNLYLCLTGDIEPRDPLASRVADTLLITLPGKSGQERVALEWDKKEHAFILVPRTKEVRKALKEAGMDDVHELVANCFVVLRCYYEFYQQCCQSHRRQMPA